MRCSTSGRVSYSAESLLTGFALESGLPEHMVDFGTGSGIIAGLFAAHGLHLWDWTFDESGSPTGNRRSESPHARRIYVYWSAM